jgi:hypothetical protein
MTSQYTVNWAQVLDAVHTASGWMVLQGMVFWIIGEPAPQTLWAKGSVMIGLLFWAGWAFAKQLDGVRQDDMGDAGL